MNINVNYFRTIDYAKIALFKRCSYNGLISNFWSKKCLGKVVRSRLFEKEMYKWI